MPVLAFEKNLSLTEFMYYQECPQKFRIHRILNPVPYSSVFMEKKRSTDSYFIRGYEKNSLAGIGYHQFFETFHSRYFRIITNETPPQEILTDKVKLLYWLNQQKKYLEAKNLECWFPFHTEISLMTEQQRGRIDCLELCPDKVGLRVIDYKPRPNPNNYQTLLFYAHLANNYRKENNDDPDYDLLLYDVVEVGCYYYNLGIERIYEIGFSDLNEFGKKLREIIAQIAQEKFPCNSTVCWHCEYRDVCKIEQKRRK